MTDKDDNLTIDIEEAITIETHHANIVEVQQTYGDNLPYQRDRVVTEARFFIKQTGISMLEVGKRLILIKENESAPDFAKIVETKFDIGKSTAYNLMQATAKFLNLDRKSFQALGNLGLTKLLDLANQDDKDLEALADGGTVAGLTLDEMDTMTTRELKAALKEAREDNDTIRTISKERREENEKLKDQIDKLKAKKKVELAKNDIISILTGYKETWNGISTGYTVAMCDTKALLEKACEDNLPDHFYQQIAVQIIEVRDHLNDILSLLPSDIPSSEDSEWNPEP